MDLVTILVLFKIFLERQVVYSGVPYLLQHSYLVASMMAPLTIFDRSLLPSNYGSLSAPYPCILRLVLMQHAGERYALRGIGDRKRLGLLHMTMEQRTTERSTSSDGAEAIVLVCRSSSPDVRSTQ